MAESQYKRHEYATGGTMLALGVFLWIVVARVAKNDAAKAAAREDYLNARIEALAAYERAFSAALDRTSYEEAANQAMMSPGYKSAKSTEDAKRSAYSVASKATEAE